MTNTLTKKFRRFMLRFAILITFGVVSVNTMAVVPGDIPGDLEVTKGGSLTYQVPIEVPPGTGSMVPKLKFTYTGGSQNGVMGVGWGISGFSLITRCRQTKEINGKNLPITFGPDDRFCLNGRQLLSVSGSYGADGSVYGTEYETFSPITSHGTDGSGPRWFSVELRTGVVMEYGNATDTSISSPDGSQTGMWLLSRVLDRNGNYMDFKYEILRGASIDGRVRVAYNPKFVEYTGNTKSGQVPYAKIEFHYTSRNDTERKFIFPGVELVTPKILSSVTTQVQQQIVRKYIVEYEISPNTRRNRITTITQCATHPVTQNQECKNPVKFTWRDADLSMKEKNHPDALDSTCKLSIGDFNRDGKTDYLCDAKGYLSSPDGLTYRNDLMDAATATFNYQKNCVFKVAADLNQDGVSDMVCAYDDNINISLQSWLSDGNGNLSHHTLSVSRGDMRFNACHPFKMLDVNGDGKLDFVCLYDHGNSSYGLYGWELTGPADNPTAVFKTYISRTGINVFNINACSNTVLGDMNGDGNRDLICVYRRTNLSLPYHYQVYAWMGTGSGFTFKTVSDRLNSVEYENCVGMEAADFNGDGLTDIYCLNDHPVTLNQSSNPPTYDQWSYSIEGLISDGKKFVPQVLVPYPGLSQRYIRSCTRKVEKYTPNAFPFKESIYLPHFGYVDINKDGRTDIICLNDEGTGSYSIFAWVAHRNGFYEKTLKSKSPQNYLNTQRCEQSGTGDSNGNGLPDFYCTYAHIDINKDKFVSWEQDADVTEKISTVVSPMGKETAIEYSNTTDSNVYTMDTSARYPEIDLIKPYTVVSKVKVRFNYNPYNALTDNESDFYNTTFYQYGGLKQNIVARKMLGFRWTKATDPNQIEHYTEYFQQYPFESMMSHSYKKLKTPPAGGSAYLDFQINRVSYLNVDQNRVFPYIQSSRSYKYDFQRPPGFVIASFSTSSDPNSRSKNPGVPTGYISFVRAHNTLDEYGNRTITKREHILAGFTETITNEYDNDSSNWWLGRLVRGEILKQYKGQSITNVLENRYDPLTGNIKTRIREPDDPALKLWETYEYDDFGNVVSKTIESSSPDVLPRKFSYEYDPLGRFPVVLTNPLLHTATTEYGPGDGLPRLEVDSNSLSTLYRRDAFGRLLEKQAPDGTVDKVAREFCISCPSGAVWVESKTKSGYPAEKTYRDQFGKTLEEHIGGFGGNLIKKTSFDRYQRVRSQQNIHKEGANEGFVTITYDEIGRPRQSVQYADNKKLVSFVQYDGFKKTTTNSLDQKTTYLRNSLGWLLETTDNLGTTMSNIHDPAGNIIKVVQANGQSKEMTYNKLGKVESLKEPNKGLVVFTYDLFGNVVSETNSLNKTKTFEYDLLNRMTKRVSGNITTTWLYDKGVNAIGQPSESQTTPGNQSVIYAYDQYGRLEKETTKIDNLEFSYQNVYDASGRLSSLIYPGGFEVDYIYNSQGHLEKLINKKANKPFWTLHAKSPTGDVEHMTLGNGVIIANTRYQIGALKENKITDASGTILMSNAYTYDDGNNMSSRSESVQNWSETLTYDGIGRIETVSGTDGNQAIAYDGIGNILNKSDVGDYKYRTDKPNAVSSITGKKNFTFSYNAIGDVISYYENGSRTDIYYNDLDLPAMVRKGINRFIYTYGADLNKIKVYERSGNNYFISPIGGSRIRYERRTGGYANRYYIYTPGGVTIEHQVGLSGERTQYMHEDSLGSVVMITGEEGTVAAKYRYDIFGVRKLTEGTNNLTEVGYTGHDQLDVLGLIHMKARLYHPLVGRFFAVDPVVADPRNSQNYNVYSYVLNNPLKYTDPQGLSHKMDDWNWFAEWWMGATENGYLPGICAGDCNGSSFAIVIVDTNSCMDSTCMLSIPLGGSGGGEDECILGCREESSVQSNLYSDSYADTSDIEAYYSEWFRSQIKTIEIEPLGPILNGVSLDNTDRCPWCAFENNGRRVKRSGNAALQKDSASIQIMTFPDGGIGGGYIRMRFRMDGIHKGKSGWYFVTLYGGGIISSPPLKVEETQYFASFNFPLVRDKVDVVRAFQNRSLIFRSIGNENYMKYGDYEFDFRRDWGSFLINVGPTEVNASRFYMGPVTFKPSRYNDWE